MTGQEDTAQFFADQKLHVIASLPCYTAKNVNMQRGKGVFDKSIQACFGQQHVQQRLFARKHRFLK
jgi:hypothetical protein